jgi:hypothetical protein
LYTYCFLGVSSKGVLSFTATKRKKMLGYRALTQWFRTNKACTWII